MKASRNAVETFRQKLKSYLTLEEISQAELGRRAGVHQSIVSAYVRGAVQPSLENAELLAAAMGMTLSEALGGPPDSKSKRDHASRTFSAPKDLALFLSSVFGKLDFELADLLVDAKAEEREAIKRFLSTGTFASTSIPKNLMDTLNQIQDRETFDWIRKQAEFILKSRQEK